MGKNTKEYMNAWYAANREKRITAVKDNRKRLQALMVEYKSKLSCERCGYNQHPAALDFHHKDGSTKLFSMGQAPTRGYSWETILEEIAKCEVLCANCHRIEHAS